MACMLSRSRPVCREGVQAKLLRYNSNFVSNPLSPLASTKSIYGAGGGTRTRMRFTLTGF